MPMYRKTQVVEALRVMSYLDLLPPGHGAPVGEVYAWVTSNGGDLHAMQADPGPAYGLLGTNSGTAIINVGDWVILDEGEFYGATSEYFAKAYEPAGGDGIYA